MIKSHYGNFWIQPKNHVMENHTMENHVIQGITVFLFNSNFFVQIILRESTFNLQLLELDWLNDSVKNFQCDSHSKKLSGQPINVVTKVSFFSHSMSGHEF